MQGECDCCGYPDLPLTEVAVGKLEQARLGPKANLCAVCRSTLAGTWYLYQDTHDSNKVALGQLIAWGINHLAAQIRECAGGTEAIDSMRPPPGPVLRAGPAGDRPDPKDPEYADRMNKFIRDVRAWHARQPWQLAEIPDDLRHLFTEERLAEADARPGDAPGREEGGS